MIRTLICIIMLLTLSTSVSGQKIAAKTNLLSDVTLTMNLGVEIGLAPQWSLDVSGSYNPFMLNKEKNRKLKHYLIQPEARYWLSERFKGHFFGLHSGFSEYNISNIRIPLVKNSKKYRYEGWATGLGLSYGYSLPLRRNWNMEFSLGAGLIYTKYNQFDCINCGEKFKSNHSKTFFAPTKLAISLIYIIN